MDKVENQKKEINNLKENFDETKVITALNEFVEQDAIKKQIQKENKKIIEKNELNNKEEIINNEKNNIEKINNKKINIEEINNEKINNEKNNNKNITKENEKLQIQNENNSIQVIEEKTNKKNKTLKIILIILFILLFIAIFSTIFSLLNINNSNMVDGIFINNTEISNLSKEEAIKYLNDELNNNEKNYITVTRNDLSENIYLNDINGKFIIEDVVDDAYKLGRDGNIVKSNYNILFAKIFHKKYSAKLEYDLELLENKIEEISLKMPDAALNSVYTIKGNTLIVKDSTAGVKIDTEDFKNKMVNAFSTDNKKFEISVIECEKQEINIKKIYDEVHKEPVDAYFTKEPFNIHKEENGVDFAISIEDAKKMFKEKKSEYEIPLKEIKPKVTIKDLDNEAFPDVLASFTTYYGTADTNRNYNIYLASNSITQTVVMPGETFSYNKLIGECSTRTGYRESTIYLNGELSKGIGGGICQVSTTLYNAILRANLEIVERRNHSLNVTYVPLGHDAMVSIGSSDLKFKNNRNYPIKVVAYTGTGSITCEIYGLKNEKEYEVKLDTKIIYKTDKNAKTETYKVLYLDGKEVSRTLLSTDVYKLH